MRDDSHSHRRGVHSVNRQTCCGPITVQFARGQNVRVARDAARRADGVIAMSDRVVQTVSLPWTARIARSTIVRPGWGAG